MARTSTGVRSAGTRPKSVPSAAAAAAASVVVVAVKVAAAAVAVAVVAVVAAGAAGVVAAAGAIDATAGKRQKPIGSGPHARWQRAIVAKGARRGGRVGKTKNK